MNDEKLIRRILQKSDRAAANELIGRYYDEIYRYAYRQSADKADRKNAAEDLTQDIFVSVIRSLYAYNPQKSGFRTWLYKVSNSRIIDSKRKFNPNEVQIGETDLYIDLDFSEMLHNRALLEKIEENISEQSSDIQRIIRLHLYSDMTFKEISGIMDLPEATVKTKFYRAIKKIREEFCDDY